MSRSPKQRALMQQVIDWLGAGAPHTKINDDVTLAGFNFGNWMSANDCGTTGCIAGAAVQFAWADDLEIIVGLSTDSFSHAGRQIFSWDIAEPAAKELGLTKTEKNLLFIPFEIQNQNLPEHLQDDELDWDEEPLRWTRLLAPEKIAVVLQHFQDTDEINWNLVYPEEETA